MSTDRERFFWRPMRLIVIAALLMAALLSRATADPLLAEQRWRENSHGLSLQPPLASRLLEQSADDAVLRIAGEGNYFIKVYIRARQHEAPKAMEFDLGKGAAGAANSPDTSKDRATLRNDVPIDRPPTGPLTVEELVDMSAKQLAMVRPDATIIATEKLHGPPLPTTAVYFGLPDAKRGDWVLGQSLTVVDPETVVLLQLEVDKAGFERAKPIFEAVAKSLQIDDPKKIVAQRETLLNNGGKWRRSVTAAYLHEKLVPENWVRITEGGRDIGYMQVLQKTDQEMSLPGVRVDERMHVAMNQQLLDSQANFFLSDDGATEIWSIRMTIRPENPSPASAGPGSNGAPREWTLAETGLRSGKEITVTRQGLDSTKQFKWEQPTQPLQRGPDGKPVLNQPSPALLPYFSQAEIQMLDTLLPHKAPLEVGFYAYLPSAGKIAFRTERVVPQADGTCIVYSRLSPEQPEQVSVFAANGKLIKRTQPDGRVFLATTKSELAARNGIKLPR